MSFSTCSAGALPGPDFCFIFAPCGYDEPEILPSESPSICLRGADGEHLRSPVFSGDGFLLAHVGTAICGSAILRPREVIDLRRQVDPYDGVGRTARFR